MKMTEQTQAPTQEQQEQAEVQISLQDIATIVQMIDVVSRRGAYEGNEMAGVGMLRNKLEAFLRQNAPEGENPEGQMPAEAPANVPSGPMSGKVAN
jgi:glutamate synthase domain-containing protein 1